MTKMFCHHCGSNKVLLTTLYDNKTTGWFICKACDKGFSADIPKEPEVKVPHEDWYQPLKDLLAIIHRDGGQHSAKVGIMKSIVDAKDWVYEHLREDEDYAKWRNKFQEAAAMELEKKESEVKCPKCKLLGLCPYYKWTEDKANCDKFIEKEEAVDVPIDLSDEDFTLLAKMAHERGITFNELCNNILRAEMEKEEKSLFLYSQNLLKEWRQTVQLDVESTHSYSKWLEQKLYDNDVPVKS